MTAPVLVDYQCVTYRRKARLRHRCETCLRGILPGSIHLLHVAFPGHEYAAQNGQPEQVRECAECATKYGRGQLLESK